MSILKNVRLSKTSNCYGRDIKVDGSIVLHVDKPC